MYEAHSVSMSKQGLYYNYGLNSICLQLLFSKGSGKETVLKTNRYEKKSREKELKREEKRVKPEEKIDQASYPGLFRISRAGSKQSKMPT